MRYGIRYHDKRWWVYEVVANKIVSKGHILRFTARWASDRLNEIAG